MSIARSSTPSDLVVVGAGGHATVVVATAAAMGLTVRAVVDADSRRWGSTVLGAPVIGDVEGALDDVSTVAVLAIGSNEARQRLASSARCSFATLVHPTAIIHPTVVVGPGTVVFAGAIVQPHARLGAHVIINTAASVDHDAVLGDYVHVGPGVRLAGAVTLGTGVLMGIGSVATPQVEVGAWSTVGAGAAVVTDLGPGVVAVGVPARPLPGRVAAPR